MDNVELLSGVTRRDFLKIMAMASVSVMAISPLDVLADSPLHMGVLLPESMIYPDLGKNWLEGTNLFLEQNDCCAAGRRIVLIPESTGFTTGAVSRKVKRFIKNKVKTVSGSGGSGILLSNVNSTINVNGAELSGSSGIDIQGGNWTFNFINSDITGASGTAFGLSNSTATVTYADISLYTTGANGIFADGGALNIAASSVASFAGAVVDIDNILINMNPTFISLTNNSPIQGIDLTNLAAGSALNISGKTTINNAADKGIQIDKIRPGGDIDFGEVEIANRNEIGILIKDAQCTDDYGHTTIPNPNSAGGYGLRVCLDETASGTVRTLGSQWGILSSVGNDSSTRDRIEIRSRDNTGDYYVTLALPNLQGRAPMHPGKGPGLTARKLGEKEGATKVALAEA